MYRYIVKQHYRHEYEYARKNWRNVNATFNTWKYHEHDLEVPSHASSRVYWVMMTKQFVYYSPTKLKRVPVEGYQVPVMFFDEQLMQ